MSMIIAVDTRAIAQLFISAEMLARQQTGQAVEDLMGAAHARLARMLGDQIKGGRATQAEEDAVARAMTVEHRADPQAMTVAVLARVRCPPLPPQGGVAHLQGGPADGAVRALPEIREVRLPVVGAPAARYGLTGYDLMSGHYIYTYRQADQ